MNELGAAKAALDASVLQCQGDMSALRQELDAARLGHEEAENQFKQQVLDTGLQLLRESPFCVCNTLFYCFVV